MFGRKKDTIAARVQRGMQALDQARPGWYRRINLTTLDIAKGDRCALGQTYGSYRNGRIMLDMNHKESIAHGFHAPVRLGVFDLGAIDAEYEALTAEWGKQILARRQSRKVNA